MTERASIPSTPAIYGSLPLMTLAAYPPDFLVGPRGNISGSQASVPRGVPFFGENWIDSLKAGLFAYGFPRTVWTPPAGSSVADGSFPFMTFATHPPDFLVRPRGNISGSQGPVLRRVPLFGKNWIDGLEAVVFTYGFPCMVWTPAAGSSVADGGFPFVTPAAYPPHFLARPGSDILRIQVSILGRMPLFGQGWIPEKQILIGQTLLGYFVHSRSIIPVANLREKTSTSRGKRSI